MDPLYRESASVKRKVKEGIMKKKERNKIRGKPARLPSKESGGIGENELSIKVQKSDSKNTPATHHRVPPGHMSTSRGEKVSKERNVG